MAIKPASTEGGFIENGRPLLSENHKPFQPNPFSAPSFVAVVLNNFLLPCIRVLVYYNILIRVHRFCFAKLLPQRAPFHAPYKEPVARPLPSLRETESLVAINERESEFSLE